MKEVRIVLAIFLSNPIKLERSLSAKFVLMLPTRFLNWAISFSGRDLMMSRPSSNSSSLSGSGRHSLEATSRATFIAPMKRALSHSSDKIVLVVVLLGSFHFPIATRVFPATLLSSAH